MNSWMMTLQQVGVTEEVLAHVIDSFCVYKCVITEVHMEIGKHLKLVRKFSSS
jgi:hypothetical protein